MDELALAAGTANADVAGRLIFDGVKVEYRAHFLPNGTVNVGTLNMRPLTHEERTLVTRFASKLAEVDRPETTPSRWETLQLH